MKRRRETGAAPGKGRETSAKTSRLSDEDQALWEYMAQDLEPLRRAKPRVPHGRGHDAPAAGGARDAARSARDSREEKHAGSGRSMPASRSVQPAVPPSPNKAPPPLQRFDKKRQRRIASGQMEIEAQLDLHGMRQADAHHKLRAFLHRAVSRGFSTVLVVTGKGGPRSGKPDDLDMTYGREERGVLRRMVPFWLEEPEMRAIVASYTTAAIQHGGDGALYIHLRRRIAKGP